MSERDEIQVMEESKMLFHLLWLLVGILWLLVGILWLLVGTLWLLFGILWLLVGILWLLVGIQVGIQRTEEAVSNSVGEVAGVFFQNIGQVGFGFSSFICVWEQVLQRVPASFLGVSWFKLKSLVNFSPISWESKPSQSNLKCCTEL